MTNGWRSGRLGLRLNGVGLERYLIEQKQSDTQGVVRVAALIREGDTLVLQLTTMEKVEGIHGDLRIPFSSVQSVTVLEDAIHAVHGLKMPGTRIPGVLAMGTFTSNEGKTFAIVHHQTKRGVKVALTGTPFDALIVGVDDPERVVIALGFAPN